MRLLKYAAVAAVATFTATTASWAQDLRLLASWDSSYAAVSDVLTPFVKKLEDETTADLNIKIMGPETVPPFEQLDPVSRGLFDLLFTNGAYHFNEISVGMTLDAMSGDTVALREAGVWDAADAYYQEIGLKLIAVLYDLNGYHIMLKEPVGDDGLSGRRVRGTPIYHSVINMLGGSPVVLPGGEIYPALERGVVDGAAWPTVGAVAYKWYEVADYMMRPSFGQVGHMVLMNLDKWNSLDDATRAEIESIASSFELEANEIFNGLSSKENTKLEAEGMSVTQLNDTLASKLNSSWFDGALDLAATKSTDAVTNIRELATKAGLNN